jgi:putative hydrolase of the HAD superfamily
MTAALGGAGLRPEALIFDFGGVLFGWNPVRLIARVLPERARTPEEAEHWKGQFFQGYSGDWGAFDSGHIEVPELRRRIATRTGLSEDEVQAVVDAVPDELQPMAASVALLQRLRQAGHRLLFLSNMPAPFADHLRRSHAFLAWFESGVFSAEVKLAKPDAAIFHLALDRFELSPSQALFIDDHPANVEAANALGLPAVLFTDAASLERELMARGLIPAPQA